MHCPSAGRCRRSPVRRPLHSTGRAPRDALPPRTQVHNYDRESELYEGCIALIRRLDPDIVGAWDLQTSSLGMRPLQNAAKAWPLA